MQVKIEWNDAKGKLEFIEQSQAPEGDAVRLKKKKTRSWEKLLRLALAWPLSVDETKRLLYYGQSETLYPRVRRDAYLIYAIHHHFTVLETDKYLFEHGEPTLG